MQRVWSRRVSRNLRSVGERLYQGWLNSAETALPACRMTVCIAVIGMVFIFGAVPARASRNSEIVDEMRSKARQAVGERNFDKAVALLRRAVRKNAPAVVEKELAQVLMWAGRPEHAFVWYRRYLSKKPKDELTRLQFARSLSWTKRPKRQREALRLYDYHLNQHPADYRARLERARVRSWLKLLPQAIDDYEAYLKVRPNDQKIRIEMAGPLSWSVQRSMQKRAIAIYTAHIEKHPDDLKTRLQRGRVHSWMANTRPAIADFNYYLSKKPNDAKVRLELAAVLSWSRDKSQLAKALLIYDAYLAKHPDDEKVFIQRARVRSWAGMQQQAIADFRLALRRSKNAKIRLELARALSQSPETVDQRRAATEYKRALSAGADRTVIRFGMAQLDRKSGRYRRAEQALKGLRRRVKAGDLRNQIDVEYARLLALTDRRQDALVVLEAVQQRDPTFQEARVEAERLREVKAPASSPPASPEPKTAAAKAP